MARMEYCLPLVASETSNISYCTILKVSEVISSLSCCTIFKVRREIVSEVMSCVNITSNTMSSVANVCNNNLPLTPASLSPTSISSLSPSQSSSSHGSQQNLSRRNPSNWVQTNRINSGQLEGNITTAQLDGSSRRKKRVQGISLYLYSFICLISDIKLFSFGCKLKLI